MLRQQAVKAMREGQAVADVANAFGLNIRTVYDWLAEFADGGQNASLAKPIPGRRRRSEPRKCDGLPGSER